MNNKILVLDDDPMTLFSLESVFSEAGYIVNCILKADSLKASIDTFSPDLIVLDIRLEDGDGREICNMLKRDTQTKHIPIILLTALSHSEISEVGCDADAILGKSFDMVNLLVTTKNLLRGS